MQIIMLETRRGCEDGFTVRHYEQDKQYDMADSEARRFIMKGWAKEVQKEVDHPAKYAENKKGWLDCLDYLGDTISRAAHMEATVAISNIILESDKLASPTFRPQPTRGSAPQNPATLAAKE